MTPLGVLLVPLGANSGASIQISETGAGKTVIFGYDDLYRLTSASSTAASSTPFLQTFGYSSIGNIASSSAMGTYTYAGTNYANPHAATSINGVSLAYDNNGNLISYGTSTYTWDYRNQLTQAGTGTATSTYTYDFERNRVTQTIAGITTKYPNKFFSTTGATTTKYIYAGDILVATVEKSNTGTTTFIVHTDHLGGTNVVSDASGNLAQTLDYYPFGGQRISQSNTSFNEKRQFTGHEYEAESGLTYMMARYYNGSTGRFLSQDPMFWDHTCPLKPRSAGIAVLRGLTLGLPHALLALHRDIRKTRREGSTWRERP